MNISTTLKAAALALALPMAAEAATVSTGVNWDMTALTPSSGTYSVDYETGGTAWDISDISFTANGAWSDIQQVTIKFNNDPAVYSLWTRGQGTTATLEAANFTTSDDFTITYTYGGTGLVLVTATFEAAEAALPAVPVPAAGILLVSALAGLGAAAKRRRNKA